MREATSSPRLMWTGPYPISDYLENAISDAKEWRRRWPPAGGAVYLVSRYAWTGAPTTEAQPLYVGGNTGGSQRFCTRIGDLVADMFGFFDGDTGHHSGG